jgi:hypothetical protein
MPTNKKPRKKYNPMRVLQNKNLPNVVDMLRLFDPIYAVFEQLETGEIESINGKPVFLDFEGIYSEISEAMYGWCDCWKRICNDQGIAFDSEPLRKMAAKLQYGTPLELDDVYQGRSVIDFTKRIFMRTPAHILREHAVTEQISIELGKRHLLQEAA